MMTSWNGNIFRVTGHFPRYRPFSALLAIFRVTGFTGEYPAQRPVTRSFDVFFDLRLKKPLSKQV